MTSVTVFRYRTMLKYAKSDANWFKPFNDVANQTQSPHLLGHPVQLDALKCPITVGLGTPPVLYLPTLLTAARGY